MQDKILSVFYGEDRLPYKDASRETHYPIVNGNVFNGANNVTKIRYYLDRIGGFANVTWVVVSKLPNGQLASEVLNSNNAIYDEELGENYIEFEISSYYTTLKGDVYLSVQGYQGGVEMEQDEDTGIYSIYGTPTIQATGSIKIGVNYAPQIVQGTHFTTSDLQQVLGLISDKANTSDTFILIDNLTVDISGFNVGQVFFDKQFKSYWVKGSDNSLQSFDVRLERAVTLTGTETIANLVLPDLDIANWGIGKYNDDLLFVKVLVITTPTPHLEYTIYQLGKNGEINCWYNNNATGSETIAQVLATTPTNVYATQEYVESNYVKPSDLVYTRGSYLVTDITTTTIGDIYSNVDTSETFRIGGSNVLFRGTYLLEKGSDLGSNYNFKITCVEHNSVEMIGRYWETTLGGVAPTTTLSTIFNSLLNTPATTSYVDNKIADFMQKEYQNVNTTTYPTLDDFLASTGTEGYIYLYPTGVNNDYYQYIWENNAWVSLGTTQLELSNYYTKDEADDKFATITYVDEELDTKQDTLVSGTNIKTLNGTSLLGSGDIEYDDEFDEESTNALQNQVISKEIKELNYELAIIREELFEVLLTELDYKVIYAMNYVVPDSLSDSDGTHRLVYSETMLKEVEGNGVALNQMIKVRTSAETFNDITVEPTSNAGELYIHGTASGLVFTACLSQTLNLQAGRKYLFKGALNMTTNCCFMISSVAKYFNTDEIYEPASNITNQQLYFRAVSGTTIDKKTKPQFIDLTQMFGAGNEPTTTSDVRIQWLLSLGYVPYNEGNLENTTISGVRVKDSNGNVVSTISLPQTTLLGALNSHDTLSVVEGNVVEGEQLYNIVHTSNDDVVDLGSFPQIDWYYDSPNTRFILSSLSPLAKTMANNQTIPNAICSKYQCVSIHDFDNNLPNMSIRFHTSNGAYIMVRNTAYTNLPDFISSLSGIQLQYELAAPTKTIVAQDLHFDQVSSVIEQGGTIEPIFEDVPPNITTTFVVKKAVGE